MINPILQMKGLEPTGVSKTCSKSQSMVFSFQYPNNVFEIYLFSQHIFIEHLQTARLVLGEGVA